MVLVLLHGHVIVIKDIPLDMLNEIFEIPFTFWCAS